MTISPIDSRSWRPRSSAACRDPALAFGLCASAGPIVDSEFSPDPTAVLESAQAYAKDPSAANLMNLTRVAEPARQELLRRINRSPGGTAGIVAMRRALLDRLPRRPGRSSRYKRSKSSS